MPAFPERPERPTRASLRELARDWTPLAASVYLPLPRKERPRAFALLVAHAGEVLAERLAEADLPPDAAVDWCERLAHAAADPGRRSPRAEALAVFLDAERTRCFDLRAPVLYAVTVGESLRLRPLLLAIRREGRFRLLELSEAAARVFEGDRSGLRTRPSLELALPERERRGARDAALAALPRALEEGGPEPIVLLARPDDAAVLRAHAGAAALVPETLPHGDASSSGAALHERARALAREALLRAERDAAAGFENARRAGRQVDAPSDVARSARAGRIRRLWIDAERRLLGHLDPRTGTITGARGDEDVLDALAALVLADGGEVRVVEGAVLTSSSGAAAELA